MRRIILLILMLIPLASAQSFEITGEVCIDKESRIFIYPIDSGEIVPIDTLEIQTNIDVNGSLSQSEDRKEYILTLDDFDKSVKEIEIEFRGEVNETIITESRTFKVEECLKDSNNAKVFWVIGIILTIIVFLKLRENLMKKEKENEKR